MSGNYEIFLKCKTFLLIWQYFLKGNTLDDWVSGAGGVGEDTELEESKWGGWEGLWALGRSLGPWIGNFGDAASFWWNFLVWVVDIFI